MYIRVNKNNKMPLPLLPLAIGAGVTAIGNIISNRQNNQAQKKLTMGMYDTQRKDALADFDRENAYNSPAQQMARLKEAGLNPNMVYGHGATATGGKIDSPRMQAPTLQPTPVPDFGSILGQYSAIKQQQAQTDLTQQAIKNAELDAQMKIAAITKTYLDIDDKGFDLGQKSINSVTRQDILQKQLENLQVQASRGWQSLEQTERMFPIKMQQAQGDIKRMAEQIFLMQAQRSKIPLEKERIAADIQQLNRIDFEKRMTQDQRIRASQLLNDLMDKRIKGQDIQNQINDFRNHMKQVDKGVEFADKLIRSILSITPKTK